jgi:hypothetical protein
VDFNRLPLNPVARTVGAAIEKSPTDADSRAWIRVQRRLAARFCHAAIAAGGCMESKAGAKPKIPRAGAAPRTRRPMQPPPANLTQEMAGFCARREGVANRRAIASL